MVAAGAEAESTNALIDAGCDVIACHVDSPKVVVERAEGRGAMTCGHNADQSALAPKGFITANRTLKWGTVYSSYAALISKGQKLPNINEGGYDKDMVKSTAFGAGATEPARKAVAAAIADLKAGKPIFVGPLKDNRGNVVIDRTLGLYDGVLWQTNYLRTASSAPSPDALRRSATIPVIARLVRATPSTAWPALGAPAPPCDRGRRDKPGDHQ